VLVATPVLVCAADLSALQERATDLERQGGTILAKPFDVDELLVLLLLLVRGTPPDLLPLQAPEVPARPRDAVMREHWLAEENRDLPTGDVKRREKGIRTCQLSKHWCGRWMTRLA
jgi:DNA-binding response OmpR family regulator